VLVPFGLFPRLGLDDLLGVGLGVGLGVTFGVGFGVAFGVAFGVGFLVFLFSDIIGSPQFLHLVRVCCSTIYRQKQQIHPMLSARSRNGTERIELSMKTFFRPC